MKDSTSDTELILEIQEQLDGVEWTPNTIEEIARLLSTNGYQIRDLGSVTNPKRETMKKGKPELRTTEREAALCDRLRELIKAVDAMREDMPELWRAVKERDIIIADEIGSAIWQGKCVLRAIETGEE